jgi:hypothetical protein
VSTLLDGVNEVLMKIRLVNSSKKLTSLTDSGKQVFIDTAIQSWNEGVDQLYSKAKMLRPQQAGEDSITLATGTRNYDLPEDLIQIRWPLHDETNGSFINKYPGGYDELRNTQVQPANYTGQPTLGAISPIDGSLYLDMIPTSGENGNVYKFRYWKDTNLSRSSDLFPFNEVVFRAMIPVVAELFRYNQNNRFSDGVAKVNYGRAVRALKQEPANTAWIKRHGGTVVTSPLGYDPYNN